MEEVLKFARMSLFAALVVSPCSQAQANGDLVVSPLESVEGLTQAEWSRAWWQWAGSFERNESPVADTTGAQCGLKQSEAVWFLAGTYGTKRTIRTCTVPKGKYLFFPLINYVVMPPADRPVSCMAVMSSAARMTEEVSALVLEVDGARFENLAIHRQATRGCFDMGAKADAKTRVFPSAANGYYVMLRPLGVGTHTIHFGGALPSMVQAVTYTLRVE